MQSDKSKALVDSITASIETLAAMTDQTAKSEAFKTWLRAVSRFHSYSFNNSLLILLQRPTATRVAGFNTWKALGRNVKKGAKGIAILAPCVGKRTVEDEGTGEKKATMKLYGFRVTHVFDVADTDGKELPELAFHADHDGGEDLLPRLEAAARQMGVILEYRVNTGSPYGWSEGGKIVVRATLSTVEKCGTLAHELAHEYLHWESNRREGLTREQRELEAEATAYALLAQFGIEQHSENYLATWSATAESITSSLQTIRAAVHHIMAAMDEKAEVEEIAA
jgi:hypothetical protein